MFDTKKITEEEAIITLKEEEDHFFDVTCKDYAGQTVQKKCVSFANADGGDFLIGIYDKNEKDLKGGKFERWNGFRDQEEANNTIADISNNISPELQNISFEFIEIENQESLGKVLKVTIEKSSDVHETAKGNVYSRKGAQCLLLNKEQISNLKLSKGAKSYENQAIADYDDDRLTNSAELKQFLDDYHPRTDPSEFLKKQNLVNKDRLPIYAGILLYDECPSAALPKKCALKITWYDTNEQTPERRHLKEQETIEKPLHLQINEGIQKIQKIINAVPIMGPTGLEKAKYPPEAIKEVLVNALIHRDYNLSDDVSVIIFNNRIEVHSPGTLPAHITPENILDERFSRNPKIVRLLNKYPDRHNHDIGEGLNTAFQKMQDVRLKPPIIKVTETKVTVVLPHETLASPEDQIMKYFENHEEITNPIARGITGIRSENKVKNCFYKLRNKDYIEMIPGRKGPKSAWRKKRQEKEKIVEKKDRKIGDQLMLF